jgi:hypothetical protein
LRARRELARLVLFVLDGRRMLASFDEGWFRQGGEVHRVMYDQVALSRLLVACVARKPDSLYLEAVRPAGGR